MKQGSGNAQYHWPHLRLRECCLKIGSGITPKGGHEVYLDTGIPIIRSQNVLDGSFTADGMAYITAVQHESMRATALAEGDVLFNITGASIGRCCLYPTHIGAANINQHVCIIRLKKDYSPRFYVAVLNSQIAKRQLHENQAGGGREGLNFKNLGDFMVPVPPLPEQTAIAEVLECWDKAIRLYERKLEIKRQIKKGLIRKLLSGVWRLPGFSGEWERRELRSLITGKPDYGINAPAVTYSSSLPTYLRITDISEDGRYIRASSVSVDDPNSANFLLSPGDVVFARTGASTGKVYMYDDSDGPLVFAGFLIRVRPDSTKLLPQFLKYFTQTSHYWRWIRVMSARSGQPGVNGEEYSILPLKLPTLDEQQSICTILSSSDAELQALEAKLTLLRDQKKFLLGKLVTGAIRLPQFRMGNEEL